MKKFKLLYFGTACNQKKYEEYVEDDKVKTSSSSIIFENAILKGFKSNNLDVEIYTFYPIAAFPQSKKLYIPNKTEKTESGYFCHWISSFNVIGIKQITRALKSNFLIKKWIKNNFDSDKAILIYSIYEPVARQIIKNAKLFNVPCYVIVADLPDYMFQYQECTSTYRFLAKQYVKRMNTLINKFDGYIFLTEQMKDKISDKKPYMVMEGVADTETFQYIADKHIIDQFIVMYAGQIYKKYGLLNLVHAFMSVKNTQAELWLFGEGDALDEIRTLALKDKRIKIYGRVSRNEILHYEKKASLLVNVRSVNETYTKYSFPSKIMEYMSSGTPMLTTKLPGIPKEYYNYLYTIENNDVKTIATALSFLYSTDRQEILKKGEMAKQFVINYKNSYVQAQKIINFIFNK